MKEEIAHRVSRAMAERVFPGCVIGVIHGGGQTAMPFGRLTYEDNGEVVIETTLYDCASITKSIPTATLALQLIDERKLRLDDLLIKYIPEYRGGYRESITIKHLLTYTVDGIRLSDFKGRSANEIMGATMTLQPVHVPGTHFSYTNVSAFLLGLIVERILAPLRHSAEERIFKPLYMLGTTFAPHGAAPTEVGVKDIVHDESARVFALAGKVVGHAGLFSTVPDLLKFCETLLKNDGTILSEKMVDMMTTNQISGLEKETGLGWELNQGHFMGRFRRAHTFGKTGFTGTSFVGDIQRESALIILSNRTYPKRPKDSSAINEFRRDICDIVFKT